MATTIPSYNFTFQQGEDGEIGIVYRQDGTPVDLTGYQVRMDVRNNVGAHLFTFNSDDITDSSESGIDTIGDDDNEAILGADGTITVTIPRATSLSPGPFSEVLGEALLFDIFLRDPDNKQRKILRGTITIEASQTRWK